MEVKCAKGDSEPAGSSRCYAIRNLLQHATTGGAPIPLPSVRFKSLQRHRVGLHLLVPLRGFPILLPLPPLLCSWHILAQPLLLR